MKWSHHHPSFLPQKTSSGHKIPRRILSPIFPATYDVFEAVSCVVVHMTSMSSTQLVCGYLNSTIDIISEALRRLLLTTHEQRAVSPDLLQIWLQPPREGSSQGWPDVRLVCWNVKTRHKLWVVLSPLAWTPFAFGALSNTNILNSLFLLLSQKPSCFFYHGGTHNCKFFNLSGNLQTNFKVRPKLLENIGFNGFN